MKYITPAFFVLSLMIFLSGCSKITTRDDSQVQPVVIDENSETKLDAEDEVVAEPMSTSDDVDTLSTDLDATVITEESFQ